MAHENASTSSLTDGAAGQEQRLCPSFAIEAENAIDDRSSSLSSNTAPLSTERTTLDHELGNLQIGSQSCSTASRGIISSRLLDDGEDDDNVFFDVREFSRRPSAESRSSQDDCLNNTSWPLLFEQCCQPEASTRTRHNFQLGLLILWNLQSI